MSFDKRAECAADRSAGGPAVQVDVPLTQRRQCLLCSKPHAPSHPVASSPTLLHILPLPAARSFTSRRFRPDAPSHPAASGRTLLHIPPLPAGRSFTFRPSCWGFGEAHSWRAGRSCRSVARKSAGSAGALPEKARELREGCGKRRRDLREGVGISGSSWLMVIQVPCLES